MPKKLKIKKIIEWFDSWRETLIVRRMFPDLDKDIKQVHRDIKNGAYKNYPTLEDILKEEKER